MGISEKAIIIDEAILDYIPQRAPIVMVDAFYGIEDKISKSGLTIAANNIFCEEFENEYFFSESGVIEHIAQSAALRVGYLYKSKGQEVPIGFIGAVNKFQLQKLPKVGEQLITTIEIEHEVMNITLIGAKVFSKNELIAECKMKIFIQ